MNLSKQKKYLKNNLDSLNKPNLKLKKIIYNHFDDYMRIALDSVIEDSDFFKFKPHLIFTQVLEIDKFLAFVENNDSKKKFLNFFNKYIDSFELDSKMRDLDSNIYASYENFLAFIENFRVSYKLLTSKREESLYDLLNKSLEDYNSFKSILKDYFDEIAYYEAELDRIFKSEN